LVGNRNAAISNARGAPSDVEADGLAAGGYLLAAATLATATIAAVLVINDVQPESETTIAQYEMAPAR